METNEILERRKGIRRGKIVAVLYFLAAVLFAFVVGLGFCAGDIGWGFWADVAMTIVFSVLSIHNITTLPSE